MSDSLSQVVDCLVHQHVEKVGKNKTPVTRQLSIADAVVNIERGLVEVCNGIDLVGDKLTNLEECLISPGIVNRDGDTATIADALSNIDNKLERIAVALERHFDQRGGGT